MEQDKILQEFNQELNTLLAKYNFTLKISQNIVVVPKEMEETKQTVETPVESTETLTETTEETA